ncbi:hypothetical protein BDF20DRAFT_896687 [Mycotypha africana]|uniref:uncharacterized protein n=1 Tax=Mycotypha africana TaxID=64632 RepID=UPI002301A5B4|nr:uncharacterized protein BDF20DRAFT_896687 [Mycotypha africana]KAI8968490.1 hypothetical protein BDF20DRAFT_896687 [Mycotypha africana]
MATTRLDYRDTKEPTAVCVYTISQESRYLLIKNVPRLGLEQELLHRCRAMGDVEEHALLNPQTPSSESSDATDTYWIKYKNITFARLAKRKLDDKPFYSSLLKVVYAPEYETFDDIRQKFQNRAEAVHQRLLKLHKEKYAFRRNKRPRESSEQRKEEAPSNIYGPFLSNNERMDSTVNSTGSKDGDRKRRRRI